MTAQSLKSIKLLQRLCPVCENRFGEVLHTQTFALPENHILPNIYDVVFCESCGFVFADTPATQDKYDNYYRDFSKYEDLKVSSGGGFNNWDKKRLKQTATSIDKMLFEKSASILDIGCANGGLLSSLRELSYYNLTGLDPSTACVSNVLSINIECFEGSLFNHDALPDGIKFDCIVLTHVLEHILDIKRAVEFLIKKLKHGGLLYIEVPDASRYSDFYIVPYYFFDCEHINHFDEHSLANIFVTSGCMVEGVVKYIMQVSLTHQYPVVGIFLRLSKENAFTKKMTPDYSAYNSIKTYVEMSVAQKSNIEIDNLANSKELVVVWGAGSYSLRLLQTTSLGHCAIYAFFDNDKSKQGLKLNGVDIISPHCLVDQNISYPIIVCSALHSTDIIQQINTMGITNRVIVV